MDEQLCECTALTILCANLATVNLVCKTDSTKIIRLCEDCVTEIDSYEEEVNS